MEGEGRTNMTPKESEYKSRQNTQEWTEEKGKKGVNRDVIASNPLLPQRVE